MIVNCAHRLLAIITPWFATPDDALENELVDGMLASMRHPIVQIRTIRVGRLT